METGWMVLCEAPVYLKSLAMVMLVLAAGCKRSPQGPATAPATAAIQQNAGDTDPALWGRMSFHIDAIYEHQQLTDEFPGHSDGGPWTFLDCSSVPGDAHFVVGVAADVAAGGDAASAIRGRAILRTADRAGANTFLAAFARAFHVNVPEALSPKPLHPMVFGTTILGTSLSRNPNSNGFVLGGGGDWTATRWALATPRLEAEVFFNYDLTTRAGEFVEKDVALRDNLVSLWARVLRDGPRGQRTPAEDANVVATGPHLGDLLQIAGPEGREPFFVPGGKWLIYAASAPNLPSQVWAVECARPQNRHRLLEFQQIIFQVQSSDPTAQSFLVEEKIPDTPGMITKADPSRFWWVDAFAGTAKPVDGPWNARNVDCDPQAISPDSHYLVLSESRTRVDGKGGYTQLYIIDLQSFKAATLDINQQWLEPVGWHVQGENLRLIARTGLLFDPPEKRQACLVDPATGDWQPARADEVPPLAASLIRSPDGQQGAMVVEHKALEIRPLAAGTGTMKSMTFNPEDRRFVDENCVSWIDNRYLSFFNPYPIFIDSRTMKMNYALETDLVPNDMLVSSDGKFAVLVFSDALVLAPVVNADNP
jgi:hypothetical protein